MRILLVKTSSLGDVVHNLPVATALHARFPAAQIDWVVEEAFADIPRLHPAVGRVIPLAWRRWRRQLFSAATWRAIAAFRRELRREAYDLVLDSQGLIKSGLIAAQAQLAPGGERVGYAAEAAREPLAARCYRRGLFIPKNLHAVERNRWLAAAACAMVPDGAADYGIAVPPLQASWLPSTPYAVLLCASSRADKGWPEPAWRELGASLAAQGLSLLLPAGSAEEREQVGRLAATMGPAAQLAPPLGLTALAGLAAGAELIVGVDTGLTHLAAALGRPTLCLFAGSDPALTGVHAGPCARNLGSAGRPPSAAAAIALALELLPPGRRS